MLEQLRVEDQNGAKVLTINPLREAGLVRFKNPQKPKGMIGHGTALTDLHLPVKINGEWYQIPKAFELAIPSIFIAMRSR